jgi:hypothetical protein
MSIQLDGERHLISPLRFTPNERTLHLQGSGILGIWYAVQLNEGSQVRQF